MPKSTIDANVQIVPCDKTTEQALPNSIKQRTTNNRRRSSYDKDDQPERKRQKVRDASQSHQHDVVVQPRQAKELFESDFPYGADQIPVDGSDLAAIFNAIAESMKVTMPEVPLPTQDELEETYLDWSRVQSFVLGSTEEEAGQSLIVDAAAMLNMWSSDNPKLRRKLRLGTYHSYVGAHLEFSFSHFLDGPAEAVVWIYVRRLQDFDAILQEKTLAGLSPAPKPPALVTERSSSMSGSLPSNTGTVRQQSGQTPVQYTPITGRKGSSALFRNDLTPMTGVQAQLPTPPYTPILPGGRRRSRMKTNKPGNSDLPPPPPRSPIWEYVRTLTPEQQMEVEKLSRSGYRDQAIRQAFEYVVQSKKELEEHIITIDTQFTEHRAHCKQVIQELDHLKRGKTKKSQALQTQAQSHDQDRRNEFEADTETPECRNCGRRNHITDQCTRRCRNCKSVDHNIQKCKQRKQRPGTPCGICGKSNHVEANCRYRQD